MTKETIKVKNYKEVELTSYKARPGMVIGQPIVQDMSKDEAVTESESGFKLVDKNATVQLDDKKKVEVGKKPGIPMVIEHHYVAVSVGDGVEGIKVGDVFVTGMTSMYVDINDEKDYMYTGNFLLHVEEKYITSTTPLTKQIKVYNGND